MSVYNFSVLGTDKENVSLENYKGKVLLIVNTATDCGLTPQYQGLEALYKKFNSKGFEILDFPCNQFLGQAPGTDEEIVTFCHIKFGITFKTFSKIKVNGKDADPLFKYLKEAMPKDTEDETASAFTKKLHDIGQAVTGSEIKWNFAKFFSR